LYHASRRKEAGDAIVRVEHRGDASQRYGQGQEKTMQFKDFLTAIEVCNHNYIQCWREKHALQFNKAVKALTRVAAFAGR
jgi:pterin-4a-carbinolamine dehydratase